MNAKELNEMVTTGKHALQVGILRGVEARNKSGVSKKDGKAYSRNEVEWFIEAGGKPLLMCEAIDDKIDTTKWVSPIKIGDKVVAIFAFLAKGFDYSIKLQVLPLTA